MARIRWHVGRCGRLVTKKGQHIEILSETDQLFVVFVVSGTSPVDIVVDIGRSRHQAEIDYVATHRQGLLRITRDYIEGLWRPGHGLE